MSNSGSFPTPCLFCGHDLQGLEPSQGCPECGLHVWRTLKAKDAERMLDSDEISACVPALQEALDCLAEKREALQAAENAEAAAAERVITAAIQAGDRKNVRASLIRELYWQHPEIKVKWIQEAFGLKAHEIREIAGVNSTEFQCLDCGEQLFRRSRTECLGQLCPKCVAIQQDINRDERRDQAAARRQRMLELQYMPYADYLLTQEWQERRKEHLRSSGFRCQVCNSGNCTLNVHHRTYERRGCEYFKDLIVLCETCHRLFHKEGKLAEWD